MRGRPLDCCSDLEQLSKRWTVALAAESHPWLECRRTKITKTFPGIVLREGIVWPFGNTYQQADESREA
jgi:hypothetical protein